MNARDYLNDDFDYAAEMTGKQRTRSGSGGGQSNGGPSASRRSFSKKRGKAPQQFNGIHRRRTKKIRW